MSHFPLFLRSSVIISIFCLATNIEVTAQSALDPSAATETSQPLIVNGNFDGIVDPGQAGKPFPWIHGKDLPAHYFDAGQDDFKHTMTTAPPWTAYQGSYINIWLTSDDTIHYPKDKFVELHGEGRAEKGIKQPIQGAKVGDYILAWSQLGFSGS